MRNVLFIVLSIALLFCCSEVGAEEKISKTLEQKPSQGEEQLSDQYAFQDLRFGDSVEVVFEKMKKSGVITESLNDFLRLRQGLSDKENYTVTDYWLYYSPAINLGMYEYKIKCNFYNGGLYQVYISSWANSADYYDTYIKDRWESLKSIISNKYNNKYLILNDPFPNFLNMKSNYTIFSNIWKYGEKTIKLGIFENPGEALYRVELYITHSPIEDLIKKDEESKEQQKKMDSSMYF